MHGSIFMSSVLQFLSKYVEVFGEGGGAVVGDFLIYCHGLTVLNILYVLIFIFKY